MTEPGVVIELGELRHPADRPDRRPGRARVDPRAYRPVALLVALALAAVLAGSAPVPDPLVETRVPIALGEQLEVSGDHLFIIGPARDRTAGGERRIRAYRLPDGRRLWESRVDGLGGEFGSQFVLGSVLLLVRYEDGGDGELIALDERTGAPLWRRPGWWMGWTRGAPGRVIIGTGGATPGPPGQLGLVTAVDPRTGAEAWRYRVPPGATVRDAWTGDQLETAQTAYLVTGLRSGLVEVRDAVTGALVGSADTGPPPAQVVPGEPENWLSILDDLVLVQEPDRRTATAYALPGLGRRWTTPLGPGGFLWFLGPFCGDLICVQGQDGLIRAFDRATGAQRWSGAWTYVTPVGSSVVASRADGPSGAETPLWLVDPATGRARAALGRWAIAVASYGVRPEPIVYRQDLPTERTWFGMVDEAAARVRLLGLVTGVVGECRAGRDSLVCRRKDLSVGIWRYR